ncbi:hypothetical protein RBE51_21005 [Pseudomonas taiwanensis]|uniref:hypothetical protein n=1 Tax=Pseudomonas taiwanensis TaxID=470150 RepID=UPI0028DE3C71|nr:hypothetical protein [Pseudomonas taiwanensis]MDT8925276.1 hypothetical protein [Pseudomonas taiwanensis]
MKIKNPSRFLATAAFVACTSLGLAAPSFAQQASVNPDAPTSLQASIGELPFLNGVNLEGRSVRMVNEQDLPAALRQAIRQQSGGGAMRLNTKDNNILCSVTVQAHADAPGMPGTVYYKLSYQNEENVLLDRNVYDFYMAAHELSHCFNHASQASNRQLIALQKSPNFAAYVPVLHLLDSSIRETYADFSAALLGASKTGDWSVFSKAVMPFRASLPDLKHLTLNATANLVNGIDPKTLKGLTFEQVNELANKHFKMRFMNADGEIDLRSAGVLDVVSELAYTGERLRILSGIDVYKNDATLFLNTSNLIRGFGEAVYAKPIARADDFAFISALHVVDARLMGSFSKEARNNTRDGRQLALEFGAGMATKERLERAVDEYMSKVLFKQPSQIERYVKSIQDWSKRTTTPGAERLLGAKLKDFIAENVRFDERSSMQASTQGLEARIQERLGAVRGGEVTAIHSDGQELPAQAVQQRNIQAQSADYGR